MDSIDHHPQKPIVLNFWYWLLQNAVYLFEAFLSSFYLWVLYPSSTCNTCKTWVIFTTIGPMYYLGLTDKWCFRICMALPKRVSWQQHSWIVSKWTEAKKYQTAPSGTDLFWVGRGSALSRNAAVLERDRWPRSSSYNEAFNEILKKNIEALAFG